MPDPFKCRYDPEARTVVQRDRHVPVALGIIAAALLLGKERPALWRPEAGTSTANHDQRPSASKKGKAAKHGEQTSGVTSRFI